MSIHQQLQTLWLSRYAQGPVSPAPSHGVQNKMTTKFQFKDAVQCFRCSITNCLQCCCRNQGQKIRLLLQDLAVLLDLGFADMIEGTYDDAATIKAFLDAPTPDKVYRTPYLKRKTGKDGKEECVFLSEQWTCSIWEHAPYICKTYPLILEQEMTPDTMLLSFSLDKLCSCTRPDQLAAPQPKENTERLINNSIGERIEADHTSKLLCYHRDDLKKIGLSAYL